MGFGDQIKQFSSNAQKAMEQGKKQVEENAHKRLREILGADYSLIKSIRLDADVGKFDAVDAPKEVVEKIRAAGLLKS